MQKNCSYEFENRAARALKSFDSIRFSRTDNDFGARPRNGGDEIQSAFMRKKRGLLNGVSTNPKYRKFIYLFIFFFKHTSDASSVRCSLMYFFFFFLAIFQVSRDRVKV